MLLPDDDSIDTARVQSMLATVKELDAAVSAAAPVVIVEGPAEAGRLAQQLAHQALSLTVNQTLFVENLSSLVGQMNPFANAANDYIGDIDRNLTAFCEQARAAMDTPAHIT